MEEEKESVLQLMKFFEQEISSHIPTKTKYNAPEQLERMAALFTPGDHFTYILNFHNLEMEYVSKGTKEVLGIEPENFTTEKILSMILPEGMEKMNKKEQVVADFMFNYIEPEEMPFYKVVYFQKLKNERNEVKIILHQVTTLTVSESGKMEHTLGVYTDITDWNIIPSDELSLIHLDNGKSYFNLDPAEGKFQPEKTKDKQLRDILTEKEIEICEGIISGQTAEKSSQNLDISAETVRKHRKNILKKVNCKNTAELTKKCILEGVYL